MLKNINKFVLAAALAAASPLAAQDTAPATPGLSTGEDLNAAPEQPAEPEVRTEKIGDWTVSCQDQEAGERCQMTQVLLDQSNTPVVEVNLFSVPEGGEVKAGGSIMAPLETLLTAQMTIAVDDSSSKRYPFAYCIPQGCIARVGLTAEDVANYKAGAKAFVSIVPAIAADQTVKLEMSLSGFTKAFDTINGK